MKQFLSCELCCPNMAAAYHVPLSNNLKTLKNLLLLLRNSRAAFLNFFFFNEKSGVVCHLYYGETGSSTVVQMVSKSA